MSELVPVSARRRRKDRAMRALLGLATVVALVPLVLILYYLFKKGVGAWNADFFTKDPTGSFLGDPGGIKSAILGTIEMVGLATLIAVPLGIAVALYLSTAFSFSSVQLWVPTRFAFVVALPIRVANPGPFVVE